MTPDVSAASKPAQKDPLARTKSKRQREAQRQNAMLSSIHLPLARTVGSTGSRDGASGNSGTTGTDEFGTTGNVAVKDQEDPDKVDKENSGKLKSKPKSKDVQTKTKPKSRWTLKSDGKVVKSPGVASSSSRTSLKNARYGSEPGPRSSSKLFPHPLIGLGIVPQSPVSPQTKDASRVLATSLNRNSDPFTVEAPNQSTFSDPNSPLKPGVREFTLLEGKENSHPSLLVHEASDDEDGIANARPRADSTPTLRVRKIDLKESIPMRRAYTELTSKKDTDSPTALRVHFGTYEKSSRSKISPLPYAPVAFQLDRPSSPAPRSPNSQNRAHRSPGQTKGKGIGSRKYSLAEPILRGTDFYFPELL